MRPARDPAVHKAETGRGPRDMAPPEAGRLGARASSSGINGSRDPGVKCPRSPRQTRTHSGGASGPAPRRSLPKPRAEGPPSSHVTRPGKLTVRPSGPTSPRDVARDVARDAAPEVFGVLRHWRGFWRPRCGVMFTAAAESLLHQARCGARQAQVLAICGSAGGPAPEIGAGPGQLPGLRAAEASAEPS